MKKIKLYTQYLFLIVLAIQFVQCVDDDDNGNVIEQISCSDGIQNGDETGIDCGGSACEPCIDGGLSFSGIYVQEDIVGRPTVNLFLGGSDADKNNYNVTIPSDRDDYQTIFMNSLEAYYDMYAISLGFTPETFNYEPNVLGQDASQLSAFLAKSDALQVAPDGETTYYNSTSGIMFTGRKPQDDAVDFMLKLYFGGASGNRLDGTNDTPILVTDNVGLGDRLFSSSFPYLEAPLSNE